MSTIQIFANPSDIIITFTIEENKKMKTKTLIEELNLGENFIEIIPDTRDINEIVKDFKATCEEIKSLQKFYTENIYSVITCLSMYYINLQMLFYTITDATYDFCTICENKEKISLTEMQNCSDQTQFLTESMRKMRKDMDKLIGKIGNKLDSDELETLHYLNRLLNRSIVEKMKIVEYDV